MRALYARGLIAAVLLVLAGCAAFAPKLEAPRLALVSASMTSGDIFSQNFLVRMHFQNPNDRELPIRGIDYLLVSEGDSFAEVVTPNAFGVHANSLTECHNTKRTFCVYIIWRFRTRLYD